MAEKNIQMTQRNAANNGWDNLFPKTKVENVTGLQSTLDAKLDANLRNVANGFGGLDPNGKLSKEIMPNSMSDRTKLFEINLKTNPTAEVSVGNLTNYKNLLLVAKRVRQSLSGPMIGRFDIFVNNLKGSDYMGHINGGSIVTKVELATTSTYNTSNYTVDSFTELDYFGDIIRGVSRVSVNTDPSWTTYLVNYQDIMLRDMNTKTVDSVQFRVLNGAMNDGIIEVWGVPK